MNDLLSNVPSDLRNARGLKMALISGAAILLLLVGLLIWAASAAVGWLSDQAPVAKKMFSEQFSGAMAVLDNKAPELRQKPEGIAPGIKDGVRPPPDEAPGKQVLPGEDLGTFAKNMFSEKVSGAMAVLNDKAPVLREKLEGIAPGIKEGVQPWLPDAASEISDVPGEDLGMVARYEGLVRTMYVVENNSRTVTFEGHANFRPVLEHYQAGFAEKGWSHRLLFAAAGEEKHEYSASDVRVKLHVRESGGAVRVAITEFAAPQVGNIGSHERAA